ncbi:MAG: response regulator [Solirubrobacteraceae bacterium]|nr:response regulator [Solirubrobacteraceae bacterium]
MARPLVGMVEDNPDDVAAFRRGFGKVADLRIWESGEALLASILEESTLLADLDLIFLDLGLPGIDGVHVAHTIRSAPGGNELPIVVLSGSQAESDIVRALEADVTEYEVKPNSLRDLKLVVARAMALIDTSPASV